MTREIETAHLALHPWRATDLDPYARLLADPHVMRYRPSIRTGCCSLFLA